MEGNVFGNEEQNVVAGIQEPNTNGKEKEFEENKFPATNDDMGETDWGQPEGKLSAADTHPVMR